MKTNVAQKVVTHNGAPAFVGSPEHQLRRSILACMLWENGFYEDGQTVGDRIAALVPKVGFDKVAEIAVEAREQQKLRHAPLLLLRECVKHFDGKKVGDLIARVIQRPDEMGELISLYWASNGKKMIPRQMRIGIARAFKKFNEYQLAKWDNNSAAVKLRDVVFLCHVRAGDKKELGSRIARLVNKSTVPEAIASRYEVASVGLQSPETWENRLSSGEDKKTVFTDMLVENKLGALALLRNLRGMIDCGVDEALIRGALLKVNAERVLPFRFISAARHAPKLEPELEALMLRCLHDAEKLRGKTVLMIDVSASMKAQVSRKSELQRVDCALGLAMLLREICEQVEIYSFSEREVLVPARRGFALRDAVLSSQRMSGTYIGRSLEAIRERCQNKADRTIIITDEQSSDHVGAPIGKGYMLNVASDQYGVGYGDWTRITGWSESIVGYIVELETRTTA